MLGEKNMKLNEKIREYRRLFNLSQEQLAEKMGVSRQVVTKWENDEGLPEINNIKLLSKLMGISIDYLLDESKRLEYPMKRRCLRCNVEMVDGFDIKVEGAAYGIKITQQGLFKDNLGKVQCAICPECGYMETNIEDTDKVKKKMKK